MPVQVAVRSYMAAGVAMVGATALIAAPLAVPPPEIHLPAIHASSAEVQLAALANPIAEWVTVIQNTFTNVAALGQQFQSDPAPILLKILSNQLANATTVSDALANTAGVLVGQLTALPSATLLAAQQLAAGQFSAAVGTLFQAGIGLILGPVVGLLGATSVITNTVQNVANVVAAIPNVLLPIGLAAISPIAGAVYSFGDAGQAVIDAARAGDVAGALNALANIPAIVTDAFLNGYAPQFTTGVFSPGSGFAGGLVAALLNARDTIAQALNAGAPPAAAAVAALPTASNLVSLAAAPSEVTSTGAATGEVAAKVSSAATEATTAEPVTEATTAPVVATEPVTEATTTPVATTTPESSTTATESVTEPASSTTKTDIGSDSESPAASTASSSPSSSSSTSSSTKPSSTSTTKPSSSTASEASESSTGTATSSKSEATKAASTSAGSSTASKASESKSESKKDSGSGSTGSAGSGGSEG